MLSSHRPMGREHGKADSRGATHVQPAACRPSGLLVREGDRARLRARSAGVFPMALPGRFQPGRPSLRTGMTMVLIRPLRG